MSWNEFLNQSRLLQADITNLEPVPFDKVRAAKLRGRYCVSMTCLQFEMDGRRLACRRTFDSFSLIAFHGSILMSICYFYVGIAGSSDLCPTRSQMREF